MGSDHKSMSSGGVSAAWPNVNMRWFDDATVTYMSPRPVKHVLVIGPDGYQYVSRKEAAMRLIREQPFFKPRSE